MNDKKIVSVITPCFNEEGNILQCYKEVKALFKKELTNYNYEHIFADNCSTDKTPNILRRIAKEDSNVKVIFNSRNFGVLSSTFNAIKHSEGDAVIPLLPADLQDPPQLIYDMVQKWELGFDIVSGRKIKLKENIFMRLLRRLFYKTQKYLANVTIPENVGLFQLLDRKVVDVLVEYHDYYPDIRGMISSIGFKRTFVDYEWQKRTHGKSSYSLYGLLDESINGIISFSNIPVRLATLLGFVISFFSIVYVLFEIWANITNYKGNDVLPGIPTIIIAIFFFGGLQLFFIGIIGEYIAATHAQVRMKNKVVERELIGFKK